MTSDVYFPYVFSHPYAFFVRCLLLFFYYIVFFLLIIFQQRFINDHMMCLKSTELEVRGLSLIPVLKHNLLLSASAFLPIK